MLMKNCSRVLCVCATEQSTFGLIVLGDYSRRP